MPKLAVTACNIYSMARRTDRNVKNKAWAAIFTLLLQALLPAFIYAAAPKGSDLSEVCTAFGIRKVTVSGDDASGALSPHRQHCPICAVAQLVALPPGIVVPDFSSAVVFDAPRSVASQDYTAPRLSPYLRGPPFLA